MRYTYIIILLFMFFACNRNEDDSFQPGKEANADKEVVSHISVEIQGFGTSSTRAEGNDGEGLSLEGYDWFHPELSPYDTPDDLFPKKFVEGSRLFISQKSSSIDPSFPADWESKSYNNFYVYQYKEDNDGASWEGGYNFVPYYEDKYQIDWRKIRDYGSDGNAFKFYALFFPSNTPYTEHAETKRWNVGQWQSNYASEALYNYDIMGGYHATPSLYSRMRFKLYHLLCYVRVTLYVPTVEFDVDDKGNATGTYTGFGDNAFEDNNGGYGGTKGQPGIYIGNNSAIMGNGGNKMVAAHYYIDYSAARSSDSDAPLVKPDYKAVSNATNPAWIAMYLHREFDGTGNNGDSPEFWIDRTEFMDVPDKEKDENGRAMEKVRRYEFSAYIPPQDLSKMYGSDNPKKTIFFLTLKTLGAPHLDGDNNSTQPSDGTYKHFSYTETGNSSKGYNVQFNQGTIQHFYLYVPRSGNKTITIKANVLPWQETVTDMTVTEQE